MEAQNRRVGLILVWKAIYTYKSKKLAFCLNTHKDLHHQTRPDQTRAGQTKLNQATETTFNQIKRASGCQEDIILLLVSSNSVLFHIIYVSTLAVNRQTNANQDWAKKNNSFLLRRLSLLLAKKVCEKRLADENLMENFFFFIFQGEFMSSLLVAASICVCLCGFDHYHQALATHSWRPLMHWLEDKIISSDLKERKDKKLSRFSQHIYQIISRRRHFNLIA